MTDERIERQIFDKIIRKDGEYVVEHLEYDMKFDSVLRTWSKGKEEIMYKPLTEWKPKIAKKIELMMYIKRFAYNDYSLKPVSAVFEQKVVIEANSQIPDQYFGMMEGVVFEHRLDTRITFPLSFRDPRFKKVGEERRLKPKEVMEVLKSGVPIFELDLGDKPVIRLNV